MYKIELKMFRFYWCATILRDGAPIAHGNSPQYGYKSEAVAAAVKSVRESRKAGWL